MERQRQAACAILAAIGIGTAARADDINFHAVDVWDDTGLSYVEDPFLATSAAGVGDYDNDGWYDIMFVGSEVSGSKLFRNNGDRTFTDVTAAVLPVDFPDAQMVMFADLDNDGWTDLLVSEIPNDPLESRLRLYRNDTAGHFVEETNLPETYSPLRVGGIAVADIERDGDLDIYYTHHGDVCYLLRNDGGFVFTDITDLAGPPSLRLHPAPGAYCWAPVFADFNDDGWPDLHVAVDFEPDLHFRNNGDGTFTDVSVESNTNYDHNDMGLAVGDIENDGDLDIFSTNLDYEHALHVNDGADVFTQEAIERGVYRGGVAWGDAFVDVDHDGDQDLFYAVMTSFSTQGVDPIYEQDPYDCLFINDGAGYFQRRSIETGMDLREPHFSLVPFDYDNDGDIDFVTMGYDHDRGNFMESREVSPDDRHWIMLRLRGSCSNSEGIDARVHLQSNGRDQMRYVLGGGSFYAGLPYTVHFGLADATQADQVVIRWPSGIVQEVRDLAADQYHTISEPNQSTNSFAVTHGIRKSGDTSELRFSDDAYVVITQRAAVTPLLPAARIEVSGATCTAEPSALTATIEAGTNATPNRPPQKLELFDFDANSWETVDQRTATSADSTVEVLITNNPGRFVSDERAMRMAISWFEPGDVLFVAWNVRVDRAVWEVTP